MGSSQATAVVKKVDDICECPVCLKPFTDPRSLPCIHTFCASCLETCGHGKRPGDELPCPICRTNFVVPEGGLSRLPKNFFIETLLQLKQLSNTDGAPVVCDICAAAQDTDAVSNISKVTASLYCSECQERYCDSCAKVHRNSRLTRLHKLIRLQDYSGATENTERSDLLPQTCDKHTDQCLSVFCRDCKMALCVVCGFAYHKQHSTADIKDVAAEFRQQMTADVEDMNKGVVKLRNLLGDAEKHKSKFTKCAAKAETEINEKTEKAKQTIDRHRQTLVDELAAKQSEVNKQFDSLSDSTTQLLSFLENVIKYNEELSSKGTSCDIARHGLALHHRIQELLKFDDIESTCERIKSAEVNFVASPMISSSASNTVGKIEYKVLMIVFTRNDNDRIFDTKPRYVMYV